MSYIAITQGTADWLVGKPGLLDILHQIIVETDNQMDQLREFEIAEGPFRVSASTDRELVAIWNVDYLSGTGDESWGFIKRDGETSLRENPSISREVFERCLYVINQRLQGLFIEGAFIHRAYPNGAHTCLAGRGTLARQYSIGYYERSVDATSSIQHSIVCVGPAYDFGALSRSAVQEAANLNQLLEKADSLIAPNRRRKTADPELFTELRRLLAPYTRGKPSNEYEEVQITTNSISIDRKNTYRALGLTYDQWLDRTSPLSDVQRRILMSDAIERHPLRIVGPGGSGKTLLMQLLALRRLEIAREHHNPLRVLYIVHNAAMAETVKQRFSMLDNGEQPLRDGERILDIFTLAEYGRQQLNLEQSAIIDPDAYEAKEFQYEQVASALQETMDAMPETVVNSNLFSNAKSNPEIFTVLARLIMVEISTAIKGHGLEGDKKRYVQSERRLSRLHGLLSQDERQVVYHTYERYHSVVFEQLEVLDTDDIALSLLGRLRTPIWELKRRKLGYDYVFVDETQLFNENERRILPLLTNGVLPHIPIVLALDEAQDIYSQSTAGIATLGIPDITNENLSSVHRSTKAIIRLAFFVIQRSTDLFGPDFPDFTGIAQNMEPDNHPLAAMPRIDVASEESRNLGRFVVRRIRELRKANLRQIAIICHADQYWDLLLEELRKTDLPLHVLLQRGEKLTPDHPLVILTRPLYAGGQEFDAAILVGLEQGVVPPRVVDNDALGAAVEQQSLREVYLAVTRARYRLTVVLSAGASPTGVLQEAERVGLLSRN
jgi:superfamily I DNA/RNA helicase